MPKLYPAQPLKPMLQIPKPQQANPLAGRPVMQHMGNEPQQGFLGNPQQVAKPNPAFAPNISMPGATSWLDKAKMTQQLPINNKVASYLEIFKDSDPFCYGFLKSAIDKGYSGTEIVNLITQSANLGTPIKDAWNQLLSKTAAGLPGLPNPAKPFAGTQPVTGPTPPSATVTSHTMPNAPKPVHMPGPPVAPASYFNKPRSFNSTATDFGPVSSKPTVQTGPTPVSAGPLLPKPTAPVNNIGNDPDEFAKLWDKHISPAHVEALKKQEARTEQERIDMYRGLPPGAAGHPDDDLRTQVQWLRDRLNRTWNQHPNSPLTRLGAYTSDLMHNGSIAAKSLLHPITGSVERHKTEWDIDNQPWKRTISDPTNTQQVAELAQYALPTSRMFGKLPSAVSKPVAGTNPTTASAPKLNASTSPVVGNKPPTANYRADYNSPASIEAELKIKPQQQIGSEIAHKNTMPSQPTISPQSPDLLTRSRASAGATPTKPTAPSWFSKPYTAPTQPPVLGGGKKSWLPRALTPSYEIETGLQKLLQRAGVSNATGQAVSGAAKVPLTAFRGAMGEGALRNLMTGNMGKAMLYGVAPAGIAMAGGALRQEEGENVDTPELPSTMSQAITAAGAWPMSLAKNFMTDSYKDKVLANPEGPRNTLEDISEAGKNLSAIGRTGYQGVKGLLFDRDRSFAWNNLQHAPALAKEKVLGSVTKGVDSSGQTINYAVGKDPKSQFYRAGSEIIKARRALNIAKITNPAAVPELQAKLQEAIGNRNAAEEHLLNYQSPAQLDKQTADVATAQRILADYKNQTPHAIAKAQNILATAGVRPESSNLAVSMPSVAKPQTQLAQSPQGGYSQPVLPESAPQSLAATSQPVAASPQVAATPPAVAPTTTQPVSTAAPAAPTTPVAPVIKAIEDKAAKLSAAPSPQTDKQLTQLSMMKHWATKAESAATQLATKLGFNLGNEASRKTFFEHPEVRQQAAKMLVNDPMIQQKFPNEDPAKLLDVSLGIWDRLPDMYKALVIGGLTVGAIGLFSSIFSSSEEGTGLFGPLAGLAGTAALGYGITGGQPQKLLQRPFWNDVISQTPLNKLPLLGSK